jgi:undecaprenyl-diphosphatase
MDIVIQALIMGIVQGLTEFLPISSSGHLIVVPFLLDVNDVFLNSLAFSVMLHVGTVFALLGYFWRDWVRLIPAGLAALRDRSFRGDPDRRLAWLLAVSTIPGGIAALLFEDVIETTFRNVGLVAMTLLVGAAILWLADRWNGTERTIAGLTFPIAALIGAAQALALIPGISRSGISISAGRFAGLDRESAARFSFLMATPITAAAGLYQAWKLVSGEVQVELSIAPLVVGMVAALVSGVIAIHGLLRFLRTRSLDVFVWYRVGLAAVVLVFWLS